MKYKVLSIIQPHSSLIANGKKHYETREYKTNYRGKILIHASKTDIPESVLNNADLMKLAADLELLKGYVIAEAELTDCIPITEEFRNSLSSEEKTMGYYTRKYAWKLENVKMVNQFPVSGKPWIFTIDIDGVLEK